MSEPSNNLTTPVTFRISPIISITLISLYGALSVPLPFLLAAAPVNIPVYLLVIGIAIGFIAIYGALSERVILEDDKISVTYPRWVPRFFRSGWSLNWSEVKNLRIRTTGQGGLVYYFVTHAKDSAYLLPMRVAGFARMVRIVEAKTGIDTGDVRPLAQPWMYLILFVCTLLLWLVDIWTIWTANTQGLLV